MEKMELKAVVEGLLFASGDEGVTIKQLTRTLDCSAKACKLLLDELMDDYEHTSSGIMMMQSHEVYHLTTKPEHSHYFKTLLQTPQSSRLSQAGLETLAIIAYQQPITRMEIEEVRGVNSERPVQTLLARSFIEEVGRKDTVGRPILFGTHKDFLTYFGLTSLDELPLLPEQVNTEELEHEADLFLENFKQMEE
ncbi:MAG TPA: SMC-Scp complex subunit ScpB [Virgibacillus sp.]|nr:SMC-Scp complex subunit ScpB [Virgibacillus sp.]